MIVRGNIRAIVWHIIIERWNLWVSAIEDTNGEINEVRILMRPSTFPIADEEKPSDTCSVVMNRLAIEKWK